ncbi:UDP-N-acetylmuramoyl-L-alanyl-D-glutamate--2,6-diaminopimelate ligase MurE homolog, chloroplastic isoform X2 [Malania oleifera]|uniref:UDP-N-acetylmuramoyl-L-alanyl-D-glutamate--2, 6-diaminopimelate ligase MurE homolog, chloroplastic isoform X2 n=1 Tax=Malania oleifera TaxID=397392 RepID=UPI0025AE7061|nr:UDP-N-acetylmuramoyl-L-alanyl-D-glutamate--2,6-diaminopimelate ligase MurE homolog, chloroplastic isoform X2 [Malania oleifera]
MASTPLSRQILLPSPPYVSLPSFSLKPSLLCFNHLSSLSSLRRTIQSPAAIGPDGKYYPTPSDDDPPEASEDTAHGVSKFEQIHRQAARARRLQEEQFKKDQPTFLAALADEEDAPDNPDYIDSDNSGDDLFGEIDKAIALKRKEFVKQGLLKPNPKKEKGVQRQAAEGIEELLPEEVVDLEEIKELQGLTVIPKDSVEHGSAGFDELSDSSNDGKEKASPSSSPSFDIDLDSSGKSNARIVEPKFKMTLAELLDESKVVPVSVFGDLEVEITGVQHDSRLVCSGDLFVCCVGMKTDGHLYLSEADKRGAVAAVASKEIDIEETLGCKALVIVEDTNLVLPVLAASFYRHPSKNLSVIGISGTHGKTTTAYLIKGMYEAMGLRSGMLSTVAYYVHGENKLESPNTTPDAVLIQKLMAKMIHNGTEAVVMEASFHGLALGRSSEVDFDIAVFTNLTRDHRDFHGSEEEYRDAKAKLFSRMVDPQRHRKIVNIDDPNASFFIAQGNPNVPVVTFAMENKNAHVHPLKFDLSLFETQVLVNTPQGILEISSGLLGRHNIYNILATVAVGIAVGAPLEDIVRGIEEVDAVPGRCELIDEEQAFGVIVDYAHTPDALSRLLDSVRELGPRRIITVDILDDMLSGVGWSMQDYLKYGENDYYPPLPNGHRLFLHDIRRVAVRAAVAMGEEGDMVVVTGKGHETYQIEGDKKEFFDDREECREALYYVDELHQAGIDTSEFPWRLPESH